MNKYLLFIFILTAVSLAACGNDDSSSSKKENQPLTIYTTVYPLMDFTEKIGGEHVEADTILPPGADSHTFEPDTKQMIDVAEADGFLYSSKEFESYAGKISAAVEAEDVKILEAAEGINLESHVHQQDEGAHEDEKDHKEDGHDDEEEGHDSTDSHEHGDHDPHVWLDPVRSIQLAENITDFLIDLKPQEKETFEANFENLKKELQALDTAFHEELETLPQNKIIVSHAAYGYWEQAYGLEQIAVSGLSPTEEPSQKQLEQIIETAEANDLKYVLFEQNVTPKIAEVVQKEINGEALRLHNLSVLTEEDIENREDYFSLMNQNLEVLKKALQ
ncbi:zinc transport system substrate-binding protein [Thalassobacillus cyri]|uniref:Zinc transport system substrate-binding protein n=1 Tax=Thalassobacillus cyri TaxID=571932 RepID=A0A1H3YZR1_9BACI|nr:zinc ABC transporter substrate-binding protein [Thalassobacillus cyri]SEA17083.1 zinc transport system substrate-binding protein [Thalassobacillus cyri]